MNWSAQLALFAAALFANGFSAFAGGGAGLLQLPVLLFLGLPFGAALATHKIATVALGLGATARHTRDSRLEPGFVLFILGVGVPGVILGANLILALPQRAARIALGLLTLGIGVYSLARRELGQTHSPIHRDMRGYLIGGAMLFLIGTLNGSLASGTGLFVTLWLIGWFGLDYQRAVAYTLVLVGLFWNGAGALTLTALTHVQWDWLPALLAGSLLGGYLGAHFSLRQGNRWIKRAFEFVTLAVGVALLAR